VILIISVIVERRYSIVLQIVIVEMVYVSLHLHGAKIVQTVDKIVTVVMELLKQEKIIVPVQLMCQLLPVEMAVVLVRKLQELVLRIVDYLLLVRTELLIQVRHFVIVQLTYLRRLVEMAVVNKVKQ